MNARKAKALRKIAKTLTTNFETPVIRFFVEKVGEEIKTTLVPMPLEWGNGTFRRVYQSLK